MENALPAMVTITLITKEFVVELRTHAFSGKLEESAHTVPTDGGLTQEENVLLKWHSF